MNSKMNPARVDREDERRMLPCRNFLDGFCPRGNRCRFYHPLPSSLPTVIRVPNLPSSFQQNNFGQFPVHTGPHSMFSLSPTHSSRSHHLGLSPKLGMMGSPVSSRFMGMNGLSSNFGRGLATPISPTYSEYEMAYAQQMEIQKEKERRAAAPPVPETEETSQNTVFSHIDWKEFLTPGALPPPPTHVPYMSQSPGKTSDTLDSLESLIRSAGNAKLSSPLSLPRATFFSDRPPSQEEDDSTPSPAQHHPVPSASPKAREFARQIKSTRMLSAKEELQMKVKQIAKELAAEPAQHVQSLDTFFRNYTFQSVPTAPSSEQDLVGNSPREAKEVASDASVSAESADIVVAAKFGLSKSETTTIMTGAFSTSDSGMSSQFCSGDSACSVESVKTECDDQVSSDSKESVSPMD